MSKRMAGMAAIAIGAILGVGRSGGAQDAATVERHSRGHRIQLTGAARVTVDKALRGAIRRLSMPRCQQLFEDFSDQAGRTLMVNVSASGKSPGDFLADLYFAEGDQTTQCRRYGGVAAFTSPGSRVIHVCGRQFLQFAANRTGGEILLIHELLHTLGLGENPPTSSQITNAVMNRCR